jgi:hypothetical protein
MKKTLIRVIALALVAVTLVCCLASCGKKLSGSYEALDVEILGQKMNVTYNFKGNEYEKVSKTTILGNVNTETEKGTYEIVELDDGTMEITFKKADAAEDDKGTTYTFEEGEGYIKIGTMQLNKIEEK